jgi:hypothetical protein
VLKAKYASSRLERHENIFEGAEDGTSTIVLHSVTASITPTASRAAALVGSGSTVSTGSVRTQASSQLGVVRRDHSEGSCAMNAPAAEATVDTLVAAAAALLGDEPGYAKPTLGRRNRDAALFASEPMPPAQGGNTIAVTTFETCIGQNSEKYVVYTVILNYGEQIVVTKRYNQFKTLHKQLQKNPKIRRLLPAFPKSSGKSLFVTKRNM